MTREVKVSEQLINGNDDYEIILKLAISDMTISEIKIIESILNYQFYNQMESQDQWSFFTSGL